MPKRKLEDQNDSAADTPSPPPTDVDPLRSERETETPPPPPPPSSETDESSSSSAVTDSSVDVPTSAEEPRRKKKKKSVIFDKVTVFYFPRTQGFTCVPSEGGSTLGMTRSHSFVEDFSVPDYAREQKRIHKIILKEQQQQGSKMVPSSRAAFLRSVDEDSDDSESDSESDFEVDEYFFLQPVPIRQRRLLLRSAGIRKINSHERDDCRQIRQSREVCGCQCKVFCDPESCSCSIAGIKCQVDRLSFPCGCSKDGCGNSAGRIEFNPIRVRTHFIHTLMRIELENKDKACSPFGNNKQLAISDSSAASKESDSDDKDSDDSSKNGRDSGIDLTDYNSNERGSCRDCQNSEVCQVMMQEAQYASMEAEQRKAVQQFGHMEAMQTNGHVEALPRVLLFNDSDDEIYNAENASLYGYNKQEESSYSETSECSSESSANGEDNDYHQQKSYQTLSSFDEETNQEYCASGSLSVGGDDVKQQRPPSQMQQQQQQQQQLHNNNNNNNHISNNNKPPPPFPSSINNNNNNNLQNGLAQKYMDLNSSSSTPSPVYKLEPVSHLMNRLDNGHNTFSGQPNGFGGQSNGRGRFDAQTNGFNGQSNGHNAFSQSNGHSAFGSQNTFNNQTNSHNTFHSQSNGHSTFNGQPNGRNAFESRNTFGNISNGHNVFNGQSSNHNTFSPRSSDPNTFNRQNTFGRQSNGPVPAPFGNQPNGSNPFNGQSNGPVLFGTQTNGPNPFSNQSNGPNLFGTQTNNHISFGRQPTQPSGHPAGNWSGGDQSRSIHHTSSSFDEPTPIFTSLSDTTTDQLAMNCPAISSHMNNYGQGGTHPLDFNPHQGSDAAKIADGRNQPAESGGYSNFSMDDSHTATSSAMSTSDQSLISSFYPSNTTESDLLTSSSGSCSGTSRQSASEDLQMFSEQESSSSAFQDDPCSDFKSNKDSTHFKPSDSGSQNFGEIIKESIVETVSA